MPVPNDPKIAPDGQPPGGPSPENGATVEDQDRFARLLEHSGQPFLLLDPSFRIVRANRAFQQLLGRTAGDLLGRTIDEITPESSRPTTAGAVEQLWASGEAQRYEKEYLHADGTAIPVTLLTDLDRDADGRVRGIFAFVTDIRERRRDEEALRASEERFRQLYDEAPFGYHVIDVEGKILSVNQTECELLGYSVDELLGHSIFEFIVEGQRESSRWTLAERVRGERPVQEVERVFRTKDGRERIFAVENRVLRDRDGQIIGVRGTMQDVTQRKRTEAALVASERRLRALFEGIEDAVFVHDLQGRILDANPAASRRLGYNREEFLKLNTSDIDDPDFAHGFADRLEAQLRHGSLSCEGRHLTKDGRSIPVDINTSLVQLEDQTAVLAVIRDITERKALEETRRQFADAQMRYAREVEEQARELARSEARYRGLTEGLLDAVVVTDSAGRITLLNRAAERVFGHEPSDALGKDLADLIPDEPGGAVPSFQGALQAADPSVVGQTVEVIGRRLDGGRFPVEVSVAAVGGEPAEFVASFRDLTERNRMRAVLMQTEKLASIGLLSAGVAHEINNPLAFIANNLAVLDRDLGGLLGLVDVYRGASEALAAAAPEAAARADQIAEDLDWDYLRGNLPRMLARTRDGVQRVAVIVQNLRGLARTSPTVLEPVALSDLVDGALELVMVKARRANVEIQFDRPALPKIACVPSQIGQVLLNLLVNAVQAIESANRPGGGHVRIAIRAEPGRQVIELTDDGVGIPDEDMHRLFDPFYTTKPVGEGTGLGLAISHGIVTGHGGTIEVRSARGQGTTFRITLPTSR